MPESLSQLDEVSKHPVFCKSVAKVEVNVSFYDKCLAEDKLAYKTSRRMDLYQRVQFYNRPRFRRIGHEEKRDCQRAMCLLDEWETFGNDDYENSKSLGNVDLLAKAYEEYRRRYQAQEDAKVGGRHLQTMAKALSRMINLKSIILCDRDWERSPPGSPFSDEALTRICLQRMPWKRALGAPPGAPPVDILPGLFKTLSGIGTCLHTFKVAVSPPNDLAVLQMSEDSQQHIRSVLKQSQELSMVISSWNRQDSLIVDNSRPKREMLQLASVTTAVFDAPDIQRLELSLGDYPVFYQVPQISFSEMVPTKVWPHLYTVSLHHVPFHEKELAAFVDRQQTTIRSLTMNEAYLLSGTWADSIDILRRFEKLNHVSFTWPKGGEFGKAPQHHGTYPTGAVETYILRGGQNPLRSLGN